MERPYSFLREKSLGIEIFTVVAAPRLWKSLAASWKLLSATNLTSRQNDDSIKTFGQRDGFVSRTNTQMSPGAPSPDSSIRPSRKQTGLLSERGTKDDPRSNDGVAGD